MHTDLGTILKNNRRCLGLCLGFLLPVDTHTHTHTHTRCKYRLPTIVCPHKIHNFFNVKTKSSTTTLSNDMQNCVISSLSLANQTKNLDKAYWLKGRERERERENYHQNEI